MSDDMDNQLSAEQRKERIYMKKTEKQAVKTVINEKPPSANTTSSQKNKRSSPGAEIVITDGEVTMVWQRKLSHDKARGGSMLHLPHELHQYFNDIITITFVPGTRTLIIKSVAAL